MDPLADLADRWRTEAETLRAYGHEHTAEACERHAAAVEDALRAARVAAVTLEEAATLGGYSYSHLQALVADGTIANVGTKGAPRIRRCDVPVKPGHGPGDQDPARPTKGGLLDGSVRLVREGDA